MQCCEDAEAGGLAASKQGAEKEAPIEASGFRGFISGQVGGERCEEHGMAGGVEVVGEGGARPEVS